MNWMILRYSHGNFLHINNWPFDLYIIWYIIKLFIIDLCNQTAKDDKISPSYSLSRFYQWTTLCTWGKRGSIFFIFSLKYINYQKLTVTPIQENACVEISLNQFDIFHRQRTNVQSTHYRTYSQRENTACTAGQIFTWHQKMRTEKNILGRLLFLSSFLYACYYGTEGSFPKYPTMHLIIVEVILLCACEFAPISTFLARKMCHSLRWNIHLPFSLPPTTVSADWWCCTWTCRTGWPGTLSTPWPSPAWWWCGKSGPPTTSGSPGPRILASPSISVSLSPSSTRTHL